MNDPNLTAQLDGIPGVGSSAWLGDGGKRVPFTMDARIWASDWMKTIQEHPGIPTDEGTMVTWFANAIMAGYDEAQRRHRAKVDALAEQCRHSANIDDAMTKVAEWLETESPNVPDQRPRATDVWIATQTRSRGSLHPVGSATSCSHNLKISGRPRRTRSDGRPCHCAGNVTATDAKHTKRNPRHRRETPRPPNSTGGNGGNRGPIPSPFPPLPPVQNARAAQFRRTTKLTDRHELTYENKNLQGKSPGAIGGSVQRLVRPTDCAVPFCLCRLCKSLPASRQRTPNREAESKCNAFDRSLCRGAPLSYLVGTCIFQVR